MSIYEDCVCLFVNDVVKMDDCIENWGSDDLFITNLLRLSKLTPDELESLIYRYIRYIYTPLGETGFMAQFNPRCITF